MADVVRFPPSRDCPLCSTRLRRATTLDIEAALADPKLKHLFLQAVQGDMAKKSLDSIPAWLEQEATKGSWLLICPGCGHKSIISDER